MPIPGDLLTTAMAVADDSQKASEGVVNVNAATAVQLQLLPGIGARFLHLSMGR